MNGLKYIVYSRGLPIRKYRIGSAIFGKKLTFQIYQDNKEKFKTLKKYYIPKDVHFNKKGHRLIADKFIEMYLNNE